MNSTPSRTRTLQINRNSNLKSRRLHLSSLLLLHHHLLVFPSSTPLPPEQLQLLLRPNTDLFLVLSAFPQQSSHHLHPQRSSSSVDQLDRLHRERRTQLQSSRRGRRPRPQRRLRRFISQPSFSDRRLPSSGTGRERSTGRTTPVSINERTRPPRSRRRRRRRRPYPFSLFFVDLCFLHYHQRGVTSLPLLSSSLRRSIRRRRRGSVECR